MKNQDPIKKLQKIFKQEKMADLFSHFDALDHSQPPLRDENDSTFYTQGERALDIAKQNMQRLEMDAKAGRQAMEILKKVRDLVEKE